jgi:hypothetical protein
MNTTRVLTALLLPLILAGALRAQAPSEGEPVPGIVLVKFTPEALPEVKQRIVPDQLRAVSARARLQDVGFHEGRKVFENFHPADTLAAHRTTDEPVTLIDLSRWYLLKVDDGVDVEDLARRLVALPGVEAAVPEYSVTPLDVLPNDPAFQQSTYQWGLRNTRYPGRDIHAPEAWEFNRGRSDVVVAVIDGGIDYEHPDLDPGDRSRIIAGYDTADEDNDPMDDIPSGNGFANHGTPIAGIIGAITNNDRDVAGVMWNVKVMPVKIAYTNGPWWDPFQMFSGPGSAFRTNIGQGIEYARANGANIINLSLGSPASQAPGTFEQWFIGNPIGEAIFNAYRQGVLVFAASGNDSQSEVGFPAFHPLAIAVGNSTITDTRFSSSNYGSALDFVAPGTGYRSTTRGGGITGDITGTSFASPMAAAVGGLVLSESRDLGLNLTNDDVREILRRTADKVEDMDGENFHPQYGYGRVNAAAALTLINAPNTVTHLTRTGGTSTLDWDSHRHTFYNGAYGAGDHLASGVYFGVKQYVVTGRVTFSQPYAQSPQVWFRPRQTKGWGFGNPNLQAPSVRITNVTTTGFDYETVVFYVGSNSLGQQVNRYYPTSPQNVRLAFTVVGEPAPLSASIGGPDTFPPSAYTTWWANASGGREPYDYAWSYRYPCADDPPPPPPPPCDPKTGVCTMGGGALPMGPTRCEWLSGGASRTITKAFTSLYGSVELRVRVTDDGGSSRTAYETVYASDDLTAGDGEQARGTGAEAEADVAAASRAGTSLPAAYALDGAAPNPFRGEASVGFALPEAAEVRLAVYDLLGREVAVLADGPMEAGRHRARFDGRGLPAGLYVVRLTANEFIGTARITLLR